MINNITKEQWKIIRWTLITLFVLLMLFSMRKCAKGLNETNLCLDEIAKEYCDSIDKLYFDNDHIYSFNCMNKTTREIGDDLKWSWEEEQRCK